jgi:hypothetical protein
MWSSFNGLIYAMPEPIRGCSRDRKAGAEDDPASWKGCGIELASGIISRRHQSEDSGYLKIVLAMFLGLVKSVRGRLRQSVIYGSISNCWLHYSMVVCKRPKGECTMPGRMDYHGYAEVAGSFCKLRHD